MTELTQLTATELLARYRDRSLSPVEATQACFARIREIDPVLNAFCFLNEESALASARDSEQRWSRGAPCGPLDGVPVAIKDLILTRGMPTLRGSRTIAPDQPWDVDAPVTARLREAGAVLLGKTTTPEFGCKGETNSPLTGITRNPWDLAKTSGGSSGGTAAAVAAGLCPIAIGTDGAGSVRIPAAFCGNFGLKPSFGRVPAYPLSPFGSVAHLGPHTMSVADAALAINVMKRPDARDWTALPPDDSDYGAGLEQGLRGLRIAFSPALGYAKVDAEVARAVNAAAQDLEKLGAQVSAVDPGFERSAGDHHGTLVRRRVDRLERFDASAAGTHRPRLSRRGATRRRLQRARCAAPAPAARRARLADAPVHAGLGSARHAGSGRAGVRRAPGRSQRHGCECDAGVDAVQLSVQPYPAAGLHHSMRPDGGGPADRTAIRGTDVRRRAGAARRARLRTAASDSAPASNVARFAGLLKRNTNSRTRRTRRLREGRERIQ